MSLIDDLGGYEKAMKYHISRINSHKTFISDGLGEALLAYRREHNIIEVGDKVFLAETGSVIQIVTDLNIELFRNLGFKHATPSEIETGRRLP